MFSSRSSKVKDYFRQNEAEIQDDYFSFNPIGKEREFIGLDDVDSTLTVEGGPFPHIFSKLVF